MTLISVDIEADGPCPGLYSMVCFGAVVVEPSLSETFYGKTAPISEEFVPEALVVSGYSRHDHLHFHNAKHEMEDFDSWLGNMENKYGRLTMISDNPAFDWQFINYYLHRFVGKNRLGFSARRIGDLYCGMVKDGSRNKDWKKKYRKTAHDHNPLNDAKSNAEAVLSIAETIKNLL